MGEMFEILKEGLEGIIEHQKIKKKLKNLLSKCQSLQHNTTLMM